MIKLKLRRHMFYLLAVYIFSNIRLSIKIVIQTSYKISPKFIYLYLMNLGQIFGGLTVFIYQKKTSQKKETDKYFGFSLIYNKHQLKFVDSQFKVVLLIFFAAFFDYIEFILANFAIPEIKSISESLDQRLGCISIISSSLACTYGLGFKFAKHHKFSLIFVGICLFITIISEKLFNLDNLIMSKYILAIFFSICHYVTITFTDVIENYLFDYNYLNPFKMIMVEGIFEIIMSTLYSLYYLPFYELKIKYESLSTGEFIGLVILLFFYLFCSAGLNAYKIYSNVIYGPMARSLMDYFLNPIFNIVYFFKYDDFNKNYYFFVESEILSLIVDFFCCVHNEYIVIYYCGLDHDTRDAINFRANRYESLSLDEIDNTDEIEEDIITNNSELKDSN